MAVRETKLARGARVAREGRLFWRVGRMSESDGAWRRVAARGACAREAETSGGAWRRV